LEPAYDILLTAAAKRRLQRAPEKVAHAIVDLLFGALAENPQRVGKPLRFELADRWSARRGDFRIIYRIDEHLREVTVDVIAHRSDAYRRR
jgi:mRNA interferase RelE/StbE